MYSIGYKQTLIDVAEMKIDPERLANYALLPRSSKSEQLGHHKQKKKDIRLQTRVQKSGESSDRQSMMDWLISESILREITKKNYSSKIQSRNITFDELLEYLKDQKSWSSTC